MSEVIDLAAERSRRPRRVLPAVDAMQGDDRAVIPICDEEYLANASLLAACHDVVVRLRAGALARRRVEAPNEGGAL